MKTLYVTDLDGTLLNSETKLDSESVSIINSLVSGGMCFSYATARSLISASVVTKGLSAKIPVIAYNGCLICEPENGKRLSCLSFSEEEKRAAEKCIKKYEVSAVVYSFTENGERVSWLPEKENEGMKRYLDLRRRDNDPRLHPAKDEAELFAGNVFYYTCIGEEDELRPVYDEMKNAAGFKATLQQELYRPEYWCELFPAASGKNNAIIKLKEILGCERVVSFGDSFNDIPMFEISDEAYAVENAVPELKAKADEVLRSCDSAAVAHWLRDNAKF